MSSCALISRAESKLMAQWQIGPMDYDIRLLGRRKETKVCHVSQSLDVLLITPILAVQELGCQVPSSEAPVTVPGVKGSPLHKGNNSYN